MSTVSCINLSTLLKITKLVLKIEQYPFYQVETHTLIRKLQTNLWDIDRHTFCTQFIILIGIFLTPIFMDTCIAKTCCNKINLQ